MIPQPRVVRSLLLPSVNYPPSDEQIGEFLHYIERLRGRFVHYVDRYAKNRLDPPFLLSGREEEFELLWLAYHLAHLCISCVPTGDNEPMAVMFRTVAAYRTFEPPEDLRRQGIERPEDLLKLKDPRIQYGLSYLFATGRVNPMTYLANIVERTFRMRKSRRLI